jgi:hypothetical protein
MSSVMARGAARNATTFTAERPPLSCLRGITPESDNSFRGITLTISWIGHHRRDRRTGVGKVRPRPPPSGSAHGDGIRSIGLVVGGMRFADEIGLHHGCRDRNRRGTCRATPTRRLAGVRGVSELLARPNTAEMFASFSYVTATRR